MKCRKCKRKLRKSADFCPACGTRVKRHRLLKIIILFALLLIGVGLFAVKKYGLIDKIMKSEVDSALNDVPKIKNIEEAISYAKKVGEEVGYKNAFSELTEKNTSSVDGDHYYRMQQNYNGIPVYGRDAIYVTDKENNVIIITGNAQDIEGDVQVSPSVTVEEVCNSITEYAKNNLTTEEWEEVNIEELHKEDLCIYDFSEDEKSHLAYRIWENGYIFIIDANDAEILSVNQTVCSVTGYAASDEKRENGFEIRKIENGYCLSNSGISDVYNWNGQSSNGFKNGEKDIVNATRVSSSDRVFGNESGEDDCGEAVRFYLNVYKIEKWLEETCGFFEKTELYFNDGYSDGKNALGGLYTNHQAKKNIPLLSMGKITGVDDIDVIGHEYGHVLFDSTVGENIIDRDISEGISDIYGELAEEWYYDKNEPDWCIVGDKINVERNLKEPHTTGNAAYLSDVEIREEAREGYYYSTVISHAAYLMWNGIKGEEGAKISSSEIAKLWYRIVLTISTNCNYEEIREKAEWAAVCMQLTEKQKKCISRAFDEVGIKGKTVEENSNKRYDKNIQPYSILKVLDKDGQLYSNYILNITGFTTQRELAYDPTLMTDVYMAQKYNNSFEINEAHPFQLDVPNGYYTFTVTNATDMDYKYTFTVSVSEAGTEESIELYTDFESVESQETDANEKDIYEIYKTAAEKSISSGNWREEVRLTGDMNLVSSDQREKVKTKATLEAACNVENYDEKNLSKLKVSGDGKIQAAGQNLAWTVDYSDGVAHYQYTEPTSYTNDVAIDPICFQFNVLTREMMQDASVSGDTIGFTLSGDDMAQVTSEAMNMMNGIENLKFDNGIVKILIDKEAGIISGINMTFHASMEYMGYQADVDYDVEYQFIPTGSSKSSETERAFEGENGTWYGQFDESKVPEGA